MMETYFRVILLLCLSSIFDQHVKAQPATSKLPERYAVRWDSPSDDAWESMPLSGRKGAGANVWVQDGSVWLYLGHSAAYDEDGRLLKLGAIRLTPKDSSLVHFITFQQELDINTGAISIRAVGKRKEYIQFHIYFLGEDLVVEKRSSQPSPLDLSVGSWRDETKDSLYLDMGKRVHTIRADSFWTGNRGMRWHHYNGAYHSVLQTELRTQKFTGGIVQNPGVNNVFGAAIVSSLPSVGWKKEKVNWQRWKGSAWSVSYPSKNKQTFIIALRAQPNGKPAEWMSEASALLNEQTLLMRKQQEHSHWKEFWDRSFIVINPEKDVRDSAWQVGRNYQLFRYMLACNRGGSLPLLFNGGIFTSDNMEKIRGNHAGEIDRRLFGPSTPDMRHWMFCGFMAQNQRWLGWPAILSGDIDLLEPSTAFYRMHMKTAEARARGLGAEGVVYPEALKLWGLTWWPLESGLCGAVHLRYAFAMMLENAWMALTGHATFDKDLTRDIEWIKGTVRFYDSYYRKETKRLTGQELDIDGKLSIYPANSIELLVEAKNPIEVIAGLKRITDALIKLPDSLVSPAEKSYFKKVMSSLPALPRGVVKDRPILLPATSYKKEYNLWELPELYVAWPYRIHHVIHPETVQIVRDTWTSLPEHRFKKVSVDYSWMPVAVNMAAMGNTSEARHRILAKLGNFNPQARFPAFFGPGHDWVPDHNWGGSGMVGLQEMIMVADPFGDHKIHLLPAWPLEWDVRFKLMAPGKTIVEGEVKAGRVIHLKVSPSERMKDIIINPLFQFDKVK